MSKFLIIIIGFLALANISSCGRSGHLYLENKEIVDVKDSKSSADRDVKNIKN